MRTLYDKRKPDELHIPPYTNNRPTVIAVDFDGTLCEKDYPKIGSPKTWLINALSNLQKRGAFIVLWTCREGVLLDNALRFLEGVGFTPDAVNTNAPFLIEKFGNDCRKVGADFYIDDKSYFIKEVGNG